MKTLLLIASLLLAVNLAFSQVGINNSSPDSSAVLDLKSNSNNQGLLVPRLSMDQIVAIANPAEGLMVYCTNLDIFCFYTEGEWTSLRPWKQNADITTNQNIIANIPNGGNVGIGVDNPHSQLSIANNLAVGANPDPITTPSFAPPPNSLFVQNRFIVANNNTDSINVANPYAIQAAGNIDSRNGKIQESGHDLIPHGVIVIWHGDSNNIPKGWALCNGNNGTPNLSGRFVMGAGSRQLIRRNNDGNFEPFGSATTFSPNQKSGADQVILSVGEMPSHTHPASASQVLDKYTTLTDVSMCTSDCEHNDGENKTYSASENRSITVTVSGAGGNQAHENRPPYYVLCYIMKL